MSSSQSSPEMKIKIIIALLYLGMILSAAEEEKKNLPAVVGGNITLPDPLMERGFLSHGLNTIAKVENSNLKILEDIYRNKLHWNQTSGLFTITDLQRSDSGVYTIDSKEGRVFRSSSNVTVYDPVETPAVNRTETENHEGNSTIRTNWILILVPIIIAVILLGSCWFFCRDKIKKKIRKTPGREEVL